MQLKELKVVVREVKEVKVGQERTESQGIYSEALHRLIAVSVESGIHRILFVFISGQSSTEGSYVGEVKSLVVDGRLQG